MMRLRQYYLLWFAPLLLLGGLAAAEEPLTLRQAIYRAIGANPEATVARADRLAAGAAVSGARAQLLPQLNFTEDISRGNDPVYAFGMRLRQQQFTQADFALDALNRPAAIGNFSSRLTAWWLGFDSFKTEREIRGARLMSASAASSAKAVDQQIVLQVVRAYQSVLYARREAEVARHEQETAEALLTSVDDRVKAGLAVESDRMSAQVNLAARKEELIAAEGDVEIAWAELRTAMGAEELQPTELKPMEAHVFPQTQLEEELALAGKMRPDLTAMGQAQQAQGASVSAARSAFGPRVSAYGNWEEDRGSLTGTGGSNWVGGMQISVDLLPIGKRAGLARENAAKLKIDAQLAQSRQNVRLEVSRAHIQQKTAELSLEAARAAMDQAAESLRILKNRYGAGLATMTDLLRAEDAERASQTNYWRAVYGNNLAHAGLLYATGTLTPEAAEELQ
jgi:outer membrane protein TolC